MFLLDGALLCDELQNFFKFLVDHKGRPVKRFNQAWNQVEVEQAVYHELMARHGADSGTAQASR